MVRATFAFGTDEPKDTNKDEDDEKKEDELRESLKRKRSRAFSMSVLQRDEERGVPFRFALKQIEFQVRSSSLMSDLFVYIPFLIMFVFFFISGRNIGESYFIVNSVRDLMEYTEMPEITVEKKFDGVGNPDDWHLWFRGVVLTELWRQQPDRNYSYNASDQMHYAMGQNILLGAMRVRTLRVTNASCEINTNLYEDTELPFDCFGEFNLDNEMTKPYGGVNGTSFLWTDPSQVKGGRTTGDVTWYPGGGYMQLIDFRDSLEHVKLQAASMVSNGYIDTIATRFIIVEFFLYTPQFNIFTSSKLFLEVTAGGSWIPNSQNRMFKVWTKADTGKTIFDFAFLLFVLYYVVKFFVEWFDDYRKQKRFLKFILEMWNFLEIANLVVFMIVFAMRITWINKSRQIKLKLPFVGEYPGELESVLWLFTMQVYLNSINTVISFLKLLKFVRLNNRLNILTRTMEASAQNIVGVLLIFLFVVFGYSITGNTLFGNAMWDWRNLNTSFSTLMRMLLGDFDYPAMREENRFLAFAFFWSFVVLGLFLLLNFIIAIIAEGFAKVSVEQKVLPLDEQIMKGLKGFRRAMTPSHIKKQIQLFFNRKSEKQLLRKTLHVLELRYKSQQSNFTDENDMLLFKSELPKFVPQQIIDDLGTKLIDELWEDVIYEYELNLRNDSELEKKEQMELIRLGVEAAMAEPMEAVEELERKMEALKVAIANVHNMIQLQQQSKR